MRVLIVEDDTDISELLTMLVEDAGAEPVRVFTGDDALSVAAQGVAVAIVDLGVPRLRGAALLTALASLPRPPAIIVVSAARDADAIATAHHAAACFSKPFDVRALRRRVTELLAAAASAHADPRS